MSSLMKSLIPYVTDKVVKSTSNEIKANIANYFAVVAAATANTYDGKDRYSSGDDCTVVPTGDEMDKKDDNFSEKFIGIEC